MAEEKTALRQQICEVLASQKGVLFSQPAIVHRAMYSGRGIIGPNTEFSPDLIDERGSLPVEWWIMSKTEARNAIPIKNEGVTSVMIGDKHVLLTEALKVAEDKLMGGYASLWPLTKVLDIGGTARRPRFQETDVETEQEVPPIPCHVHSGDVVGGRCVGHGKTEAYFFPPLNVPPYNLELDAVKTRLGLKPGTTKEQVLEGLKQFGKSDNLYKLLEEYPIRPWESWTIEEKIIHAPGPWLTFEIQLPQDDFNLLAWVLGEQISTTELTKSKNDYQLRGLHSEEQLLNETLNWEANVDPNFCSQWWRKCDVLREGDWGRVVRLFYHIFYGEGFVIKPGCNYQREPDEQPFAGIVWSGSGFVNGLRIDCSDWQCKEFLVTPNNSMELRNSSKLTDLIVFTVFPLKQKQS